MNMMINLVAILFLVSCSSNSGPTSDVCSIKPHFKDKMLYQVRINKKPINKHWYLKDAAIEITKDLAKNNRCMP